jgi:dTDP-4-dehydrorhamnose reductase
LKKIIIFGGSGLLGHHATKFYFEKGYEIYSTFFQHKPLESFFESIQLDIQKLDLVKKILKNIKPDIILNCSGLTNVEECEKYKIKAEILHEEIPEFLAKYSSDLKIKNIHISTDHLWDGKKSYYTENDNPNPVNYYGSTKAQGEKKVILNNPNSLIIRTNFFGKGTLWRKSLSDWALSQLKEENHFYGFVDIYFTPISIPLLLRYLNQLIEYQVEGIYHLAGSERISKYEFILNLAKLYNLDYGNLQKAYYRDTKQNIERPLDMSLATEKIKKLLNNPMPDINQSIESIL